ncbi:hypothetical protein FRC03_004233 [Tulasnella sp. 419]|nr:hypothetical protein FRC03_004233 [Tulasnella sp. 419]
MDTWIESPPFSGILSFSNLFQAVIPPAPVDHTRSTSTKRLGPSKVEIQASGCSLYQLKRFRPSALKITEGHTLEWANNLLREYGPHPLTDYNHYWLPNKLKLPPLILSIQDVVTYFTTCLLERALIAAIFLHAQHTELGAEHAGGYPPPSGKWMVADTSTVGTDGRPDKALLRFSDLIKGLQRRAAVICQGKTARACQSSGLIDGTFQENILALEALEHWFEQCNDIIFMDPPGTSLQRPPGDINWYREAWQKKIQQFALEIWHQQLVHRTCHTIFFNQNTFLLCYRDGNSLCMSETYECSPLAPDQCLRTMTHLSYFIAHAMCMRFPVGDAYQEADMPIESPRITTAAETEDDDVVPLSGTRRTRSGRDNTKGDGNSTIVPMVSEESPVPSSLIFTTSGTSSPPVPLTLTDSCRDPLSPTLDRNIPPVILSRLIQQGPRNYIFCGHIGETRVVAKITREGSESYLDTEYSVYQRLHHLRGRGIPRCYGYFHLGDFAKVLLMEDCGHSINSFDELSPDQRNALEEVVSEMLRHGVEHEDLEPRNVLVSDSGEVSVIDFEIVSFIKTDSVHSDPSQTGK